MNTRTLLSLCLLFAALVASSSDATAQAVPNYDLIFSTYGQAKNALHRNNAYNRINKNDARAVADNLLGYQNADGGWPKNIDWLDATAPILVLKNIEPELKVSTLENKNVCPQVEYLSATYNLTLDRKYKEAALRGIEYILATQMENGGWRGNDVDAIAFNDNMIGNLLRFLHKVAECDAPYRWVSKKVRTRAKAAFEKALDLTLRCQVRSADGKLTGWGLQHDNNSLKPVQGRSYELPGVVSNETSSIAIALMNIDNPSEEVSNAIKGAMEWLESSAIKGIRIENVPLSDSLATLFKRANDRIVVEDPSAARIWARFYDIDTNKPFFSNRKSEKLSELKQVDIERRAGYGWYGYWPEAAFTAYDVWKARYAK